MTKCFKYRPFLKTLPRSSAISKLDFGKVFMKQTVEKKPICQKKYFEVAPYLSIDGATLAGATLILPHYILRLIHI